MQRRPCILRILAAVTAFFAAACQTNQIKLESSPAGAEVELLNVEKNSYEPLGKTPYVIEGDNVIHFVHSNDLLSIRISKEGFIPEHLLLDRSSNPKVDFHTQLKPAGAALGAATDMKEVLSETANVVAAKVQDINANVEAEKFDQALAEINELLAAYPNSYYLYDIKGSVHVLRHEISQARESYRKSLTIQPNNEMTKKALSKIESE